MERLRRFKRSGSHLHKRARYRAVTPRGRRHRHHTVGRDTFILRASKKAVPSRTSRRRGERRLDDTDHRWSRCRLLLGPCGAIVRHDFFNPTTCGNRLVGNHHKSLNSVAWIAHQYSGLPHRRSLHSHFRIDARVDANDQVTRADAISHPGRHLLGHLSRNPCPLGLPPHRLWRTRSSTRVHL